MTFTEAVVDEIKKGRKIQAIKLLRAENGIGLKDAKEAVENYIERNPELKEAINANKGTGLSQERILQVVILLIVAAIIIVMT